MEFDLKFNLGTLEIGSWISTFLFGIVTSQAYSYFCHHFHRDRWELKLVVVAVWLCELAHTCSTASGFFNISIIQNSEQTNIFDKSPVGYVISTFLSAVIASFVQVYFGRQVLRVTGKPYVAYTCWFLSFLRFLGSVGITVVLATKTVAEFQKTWLAAVTWAIGAVVDIIIAVTLTMFYIKRRKEAIKHRRILDHLIPVTMQTGLLTSVSTVAIAITFISLPHYLVWGAIGSALAKIFSISLFASLNARSFLREISETSDPRIRQSDFGLMFRTNPLYHSTDTHSTDTESTVYHSFLQDSFYQPESDGECYGQSDAKKLGNSPTSIPFLQKTHRF